MTTTTTALNLDAIKARANAATPGPWTPHDRYPHVALQGTEEDPVISANLSDRPAEDIRFIAHAREDVPALVAEVERLRVGVAEAYDALRCGENDKGGQIIEDLLKGGA